MNDPYKAYKNNSINTMTRGEQLILLFDKAVQRLNVSMMLIDNKKDEEAILQLNRTRDIFNYLIVCLDKGYEHSSDLVELYSFINSQIIKAAATKDKKVIESIIPIVNDLRETWTEADKLSRIKK